MIYPSRLNSHYCTNAWNKLLSFLTIERKPWNIGIHNTGELGYDRPLYDRFLHMTDNVLGPSPMHIKYSSYVYDGFCIWRTHFPGPIESVISKFTCIYKFDHFSEKDWTGWWTKWGRGDVWDVSCITYPLGSHFSFSKPLCMDCAMDDSMRST